MEKIDWERSTIQLKTKKSSEHPRTLLFNSPLLLCWIVCCHGRVISEFASKSFTSVSLEVLNLEHGDEKTKSTGTANLPDLKHKMGDDITANDKNGGKCHLLLGVVSFARPPRVSSCLMSKAR